MVGWLSWPWVLGGSTASISMGAAVISRSISSSVWQSQARMRDGLCRLLNRDILLELWPVRHKLISKAIKDVREEAFPELRP